MSLPSSTSTIASCSFQNGQSTEKASNNHHKNKFASIGDGDKINSNINSRVVSSPQIRNSIESPAGIVQLLNEV
jgi:hypothetical protein